LGGVEADLLLVGGGRAVAEAGPARAGAHLLEEHGGGELGAAGLRDAQVPLEARGIDGEAGPQEEREEGLVDGGRVGGVAEAGEEEGAAFLRVPPEGAAGEHLEGGEGGDAVEHVQEEELAGEPRLPRVEPRSPQGGAHGDQGRVEVLVPLQALPGAAIEEGQPEEQVAQGVELRAHEAPVDEDGRGTGRGGEHGVPEGAAVNVLEAEDEHLDDEVAQAAGVHGEVLAHRDHGVDGQGEGHPGGAERRP
jgi:hypothetical protein